MQPLVIDESQRRSVQKFIEAVIRDAQYKAQLAAAFLKSYGYRPRKPAGHGGFTAQKIIARGNAPSVSF